MRCPGCGAWVSSEHDVCPACGFDISLLQPIDDLKTAIKTTRRDAHACSSRLGELEEKLSVLEAHVVSKLMTLASEPAGEESAAKVEAEAGATVQEPTKTAETAARSLFGQMEAPWARPTTSPSRMLSREAELLFGQKWLLIVGLVITVLAVGYFLKYSFDRNWIGPAGRVALAYGAGIGMLAVGESLRRRSFDIFGLYLIGGGIAVLYFASYAAFQIYDLMNQLTAFTLMALVTVFAGLLALFYDTKWLAVLGSIGGFVTPVVLSTGTDNQVALMTYMVILNAGILAISAFKQWRLLNYLGFVFTWLLFSAWYARHYADSKFWTTTIFLNLFFLTYAFMSFVYYFVRRSSRQITGFTITIPNAFIAFGYAYTTIERHFRIEAVGVITIAYAALFFAMATYLHRRHRENLEAFVLLLAKGLLFLIITVPILFSGNWITLFWAVQGVVLLWAALRLRDVRLRGGAAVLLVVALGKLCVYDYPTVFRLRIPELYFRDGFGTLLIERWITVAASVVSLFAAGRMISRSGATRPGSQEDLPILFYVLFGGMLFLAANVEVAAYFHDALPRARFAAISVLWALFAAGLMTLGFARKLPVLRRCAIGLFAATVFKVLLRDMANVETPYRILSFLIVGLVLIAASYLYHRFAGRILSAIDEEGGQT